MSYCVMQDEEGIVGVRGKCDLCVEVVPCVCADRGDGKVHALIDPFIKRFAMFAYAEVVGGVVDFDFYSVDGYVLVHACFMSYCIAIRVEFGDCFDCTSVVLFSYIKVDVAAHAAFGKAVVLCYALAFEED